MNEYETTVFFTYEMFRKIY